MENMTYMHVEDEDVVPTAPKLTDKTREIGVETKWQILTVTKETRTTQAKKHKEIKRGSAKPTSTEQ